MTNTFLLEWYITKSGLKKNFLAQKLCVTRTTLRNKINNKSQFTFGEVENLCAALGISSLAERTKIFFSQDVDINVNTHEQESTHENA